MTYKVKVIAHSRPVWAQNGANDLITFALRYPRFVHAEFMTHRVFSRNASSSRAIPIKKSLSLIEGDPVIPVHWGKNRGGMQATEEIGDLDKYRANQIWLGGMYNAVQTAQALTKCNVHKQIANRVAEPWSHISVVVTSTEWANFYKLRDHPAAQPEIRTLAQLMRRAISESTPELLAPSEWHTPFALPGSTEERITSSVAGTARVSYLRHDGTERTMQEDTARHDELLALMHMSPFEHQATPMRIPVLRELTHPNLWDPGVTHIDRKLRMWSGNFRGWVQYRQLVV
jgi:hypothetical protein